VILQGSGERLDFCPECFGHVKAEMDYLARWQRKRLPSKDPEYEKKITEIASELFDFFSTNEDLSLFYKIQVIKLLYLERQRLFKERKRSIRNGEIILQMEYEGKSFQCRIPEMNQEEIGEISKIFEL